MYRILQDIYDLKRNLSRSCEEIRNIQHKRFVKQVKFISEHIPFYSRYFNSHSMRWMDFKGLEDLKLLPVVDKVQVRNDKEAFTNSSLTPREILTSTTSGSTGMMFTSSLDRRTYLRRKFLSKLRARFYTGMKMGDKVVILDSDPPDVQEKRNRKAIFRTPFLPLRYISLLEEPEQVLKKICDFKTNIIYGPGSFLFQLSDLILRDFERPGEIRLLYTSSEYLTLATRQKIENAFGCRVLDIYGSTEFKEIAWECKSRQGYHINQDELIVEIINEDGSPAPNGHVGAIVVTDLFNKSMPLIRYDTKDRGMLYEKSCTCGNPLAMMSPKGGRATDFIMLKDGTTISPYVFEDAVELIKGISQYQVVQESYTSLRIYVIPESKSTGIEEQLVHVMDGLMTSEMKLDIVFTEKINVEENGKFKLIKRLF